MYGVKLFVSRRRKLQIGSSESSNVPTQKKGQNSKCFYRNLVTITVGKEVQTPREGMEGDRNSRPTSLFCIDLLPLTFRIDFDFDF